MHGHDGAIDVYTNDVSRVAWGTTGICTLNPARASVSSYSVHCTETVVAVLVKQLVSNDHLLNNTVRDCHTLHSSTGMVYTFSSLLASVCTLFIVVCTHKYTTRTQFPFFNLNSVGCDCLWDVTGYG